MFAVAVLRSDVRRSSEPDEGRTTCRRCGTPIVVLSEDRRLGYCFDCYDPSEVHADGLLAR
ncbi:MAG: hypothetical protein AABY30_02405 [Candidatus Thermoplasmatota archaeon]